MNTIDIGLIAVSFLIFITVPFLPTAFFTLSLTNMFVPLILFIIVLFVVKKNPIGAVVLLLAIMSIFSEYRHRVIKTSLANLAPPTYEEQLAPAPPMVPGEVHPQPEEPHGPTVTYKPSEDVTNTFEPVDATINTKKVMNSPRTSEDTNKLLIQHGLV
jgi:energy-coupling factor transporter transmembrane protein EcfT